MKTLSIEKMENLSGGLFGSCFDEAAASSIAWIKLTKDPNDELLWGSFLLAEAKMFQYAMA